MRALNCIIQSNFSLSLVSPCYGFRFCTVVHLPSDITLCFRCIKYLYFEKEKLQKILLFYLDYLWNEWDIYTITQNVGYRVTCIFFHSNCSGDGDVCVSRCILLLESALSQNTKSYGGFYGVTNISWKLFFVG